MQDIRHNVKEMSNFVSESFRIKTLELRRSPGLTFPFSCHNAKASAPGRPSRRRPSNPSAVARACVSYPSCAHASTIDTSSMGCQSREIRRAISDSSCKINGQITVLYHRAIDRWRDETLRGACSGDIRSQHPPTPGSIDSRRKTSHDGVAENSEERERVCVRIDRVRSRSDCGGGVGGVHAHG